MLKARYLYNQILKIKVCSFNVSCFYTILQQRGGAKVTIFETKTKQKQRNSTKKRVTGLRFCMAVAL